MSFLTGIAEVDFITVALETSGVGLLPNGNKIIGSGTHMKSHLIKTCWYNHLLGAVSPQKYICWPITNSKEIVITIGHDDIPCQGEDNVRIFLPNNSSCTEDYTICSFLCLDELRDHLELSSLGGKFQNLS